jgi:hypothetical protein
MGEMRKIKKQQQPQLERGLKLLGLMGRFALMTSSLLFFSYFSSPHTKRGILSDS